MAMDKKHHFKMYLRLKLVIFHRHVSIQGSNLHDITGPWIWLVYLKYFLGASVLHTFILYTKNVFPKGFHHEWRCQLYTFFPCLMTSAWFSAREKLTVGFSILRRGLFSGKMHVEWSAEHRRWNLVLRPRSLTACPWKMVVGRLLSYWEGNFSGLNFGRIHFWGASCRNGICLVGFYGD